MDNFNDRLFRTVIFCLLLIGLLNIVFIDTPTGSKPVLFSLRYRLRQPSHEICYSRSTSHRDELEAALSKASMGKKSTTVIIAIVNKGYIDQGEKPMLDMFLDSFWVGEGTRELINRLLLVAVDQRSFERCKFLRLHCYKLELILDEGAMDSNGEKLYMSNDFIKMMWRRTLFLGDVLKRGYSFIFTDTDVMWLRNPFPRLSQNESIDLQISTDRFKGDEQSEANQLINTGFYMIRSNNKTISLFDAWYARKNSSAGLKEQDVLLNMMRAGVFRELGLELRFLDTNYFSGFCEDSKDFRAVTTVHANCCRTIVAKVADLMAVVHDWKMFRRSSSTNQTSTSRSWTNHKACRDSWK